MDLWIFETHGMCKTPGTAIIAASTKENAADLLKEELGQLGLHKHVVFIEKDHHYGEYPEPKTVMAVTWTLVFQLSCGYRGPLFVNGTKCNGVHEWTHCSSVWPHVLSLSYGKHRVERLM